MENKMLSERYREYLNKLPLGALRILGRDRGVAHAASLKKEQLVTEIIAILTGRADPVARSNRGAPPKDHFLDPTILERLEQIRHEIESESYDDDDFFGVASPEEGHTIFDEAVYSGILEITQNGYGFLRARNCQPSNDGSDVFIAAPIIHALRLREGDFVACTTKPRQKNDSPAIDKVLTVNSLPVGRYERRPYFDSLTARFPNKKLALAQGKEPLSLRLLDLFVPIGKGQRGLIIAPPKAGKTTLLKDIARSVGEQYPEVVLIVLLIDERPEEVTDFRMNVERAQVIYSTFDEGADHHVRAASLALEHAKRMVEHGRDVLILLDSITKLTRAYNHVTESTGKTLTGGLDAAAIAEPKRFFGSARNTVEAGSLTILATALVDTGSRMDDIIYEEFKGTGNADIFLSRDLAERRIFPAVDIRRSGTRREELLLDKAELAAVYKLRERGITENAQGIHEMLRKTSDNADFVARLSEWLRVYKG